MNNAQAQQAQQPQQPCITVQDVQCPHDWRRIDFIIYNHGEEAGSYFITMDEEGRPTYHCHLICAPGEIEAFCEVGRYNEMMRRLNEHFTPSPLA